MRTAFPGLEARLQDLWSRVARHCAEFELVLPGSRSFICQSAACPEHCCKVFGIVPVNEAEVARLARFSGLEPLELLETRDGKRLTLTGLPANRPYHLARAAGGTCSLLGEDLLCTQYEGRPDACRVYPHYVFFFDSATERPVTAGAEEMRAALATLTAGDPMGGQRQLIPVLLRHGACPGFTGPPLGRAQWLGLFRSTAGLQYGVHEA
jgi:Fe-S-cluster containining protein